jgi:rhodanese-related sulfurtransferase
MSQSAEVQAPLTISPQEVQMKRGSALLLDVRTPAEFEDSHIEGAMLHPVTELTPDEVRRALEGRGGCIVICQSGGRATRAAEQLCASNIPGVVVMAGGMKAWKSAGLPVIEGKKTISIERQVRIAAGSLVLIGAILGYTVNPVWIGLSAFVGAGLIFAGVTDTCGMGLMLARMPWNKKGGQSSQGSACCMR